MFMMPANIELHRTSLAAIIIAMGMLVDNAIVVTDNAQIRIARGIKRRKALVDGATIPQWGLLGATIIATISFDKDELMGVIMESKSNAETNRSIFNLAWLGATSFVAK